MHREEGLDFSRVRTFNLDEYLGLAPGHPASYHRFMEENFFTGVNIPRDNIRLPDGLTADVPVHCAAYEQAIEASHLFNLLQARGVISVQERASYMGRVRDLARGSCEAWMAKFQDKWAQEYPGWTA